QRPGLVAEQRPHLRLDRSPLHHVGWRAASDREAPVLELIVVAAKRLDDESAAEQELEQPDDVERRLRAKQSVGRLEMKQATTRHDGQSITRYYSSSTSIQIDLATIELARSR